MGAKIAEELKKKLGHNKMHKVSELIISVDDINETTVSLSAYLKIPGIGKFSITPYQFIFLNKGSSLTIRTDKNFKIKNRVIIN